MISTAKWTVAAWVLAVCLPIGVARAAKPPRPNVVIIFADDLGYGDLSCYGHPTINTPHLDRMAHEGQRWTEFYVAASMCTPSRAGLMTGRLPVRNGMCSLRQHVLYPDSAGGLPQSEITLAETLKDAGYATACIGKWHLGHRSEFLPMKQGFDEFYGLPYSNDMKNRRVPPKKPGGKASHEYIGVPLMRGEKTLEQPVDQTTLTQRYTKEAIRFIEKNRKRPFFLYLAQTMPHVPLFRSKEFVDHSRRGLYGDVVEEVDESVGQVLDTLRRLKLDKHTLVVFTSDNGPWLVYRQRGGSAGLLRGGKGSTWEGGMREPAIFWWPGTIKPEVVRQMGSTLDLLPTIAKLCGAEVPLDRVIDGLDLTPVLTGTGPSPRDTMFYYRGNQLCAVRHGPYKMYYFTQPNYRNRKGIKHDPPLLYNLDHDPSEQHDVAKQHPEVIEQIREIAEAHQKGVTPVPSQLEIR
ncbi:MAG: sulfatase [Pirellulales bacterium]|nr:sulfatase [Pirellulales bacterium]